MPLYEYQCEADGSRFEVIQKFSDPPLTTCPECGGAVRRLISSPAIQFKGSGWYITDYARKGGSPESTKTESAKGDSAKGDSGKGDSGKGDAANKAGSSDSKTSSDSKPSAAPKSE